MQGITLFLMGLGKKLLLADVLAAFADPAFAAAGVRALTMGEARTVALAFPFQIYFDFSGYSDMAIGLAADARVRCCRSISTCRIAPTGLRDFWRRWHMTLSRFLRDYLYIPLGGNRHGLGRSWPRARYHGARRLVARGRLDLRAWGALHGLGLAAGVLWGRWLPPTPAPDRRRS